MNSFDKDIIIRYLSGEATEEEKANLFNWLGENQHNKTLYAEIKSLWIASKEESKTKFSDPLDAFQHFKDKKKESVSGKSEEKKSVGGYQWLKYAAAAIIMLAFGLLTYQLGRNQVVPQNIDAYNEIIVPLGEISSVILPDSTHVWLHSDSKLTYKTSFGRSDREINLEGEAYFSVAKNERIPFKVKTSHLDVQVTGTSFNIKSYADDDKIETTLEEGSIKITRIKGRKIGNPITLKPKEKLTLIKDTKDFALETTDVTNENAKNEIPVHRQKDNVKQDLYITEEVNTGEITGWKDGVYVLNSKPLCELAKILERRYNVTIEFEDQELADFSYTGVLKDLTLEQVLNALKITSQLDYSIHERKVKLFMKRE